MKNCKKCGSPFDKKQCPNCKKDIAAKYRANKADKIKENHVKYREKNSEKIKARYVQYYTKNNDKERKRSAKYYLENRKKEKKRKAKYYKENADKINTRGKNWRAKNPDKVKEYGIRYREENADEIKARHVRYRAINLDKIKEKQVEYVKNNPYIVAIVKARYRCKKYNKKFPDRTPRFVADDLTPDFLEFIYITDICPLYGVKMSHIVNDPNKASLDRIDSTESYTRDNVWWVCKDANTDKRDMSLKQFKDMVQRIKNLPEIVDA